MKQKNINIIKLFYYINIYNYNRMASTRQTYDRCAYDDDLRQSTGTLQYHLDPIQVDNCDKCLSVNGPRNKVGSYTYRPPSLIDVDSMLSNRSDINTKCIGKRINSYRNVDNVMNNDQLSTNTFFGNECNNFLNSEDTRFTHPKNNYRGVHPDRFYRLNKDPQCNIFWDNSVNTRLAARDNYVAQLPAPIDDKVLRPVAKLPGRKDCTIGLRCKK
jgi:hypothetical protein